MSSGLSSTLSRDGGRYRGSASARARRVMSEKEMAAYLAARDSLRRIKRSYPLFAAAWRPPRSG